MPGDPFLCGLTCNCPMGDAGRVCQFPGSPNYRGGSPIPSLPDPSDTYGVIVRVQHRDNKGVDKAHTVYVAKGVSLDEARARAVEAGTAGVFDDLMYYPPGRVLTVRLSREA